MDQVFSAAMRAAFWPPFAMAVGGGVLLSATLAFWLTPPLFRLVGYRSPEARALLRLAAA